MLLHLLEELHNDLGGRADEHLPLSALLGVGHALEAIGEDGDADHVWKRGGWEERQERQERQGERQETGDRRLDTQEVRKEETAGERGRNKGSRRERVMSG